MRKYDKRDQLVLAACAADWAERALPLFEAAYPADDRPRAAIRACRKWARIGAFRMVEIRGASLAAHAAAREAKAQDAACFAARAAGQAVATAHVPQHAFGAAYYALKAVAASSRENAEARTTKERDWQSPRLPEKLRKEYLKRIGVEKKGERLIVRLEKGKDF